MFHLFILNVESLFCFVVYSRVMGISCSIIKPKDVAKLHPFLNIHDLVGALHLPEDAVVSPSDVNHALAVAAAGRGTETPKSTRCLFSFVERILKLLIDSPSYQHVYMPNDDRNLFLLIFNVYHNFSRQIRCSDP